LALSRRTKVATAFFTLYTVWGATYLGMRYATEAIPPVLMAGSRFLIAGMLMYAWVRHRAYPNPTPAQWRTAAIVGCLLISGNAAVAASTRRIPSGIAALIVAMTPCWFVLIDWLRPNGHRPRPMVVVGLLAGLAGIALLVGPGRLSGSSMTLDSIGVTIVVLGSIVWAAGSIYSQHAPRPQSPIVMTAAQLLIGGGFLVLVALITGDVARFDITAVSARGWISYAFLVIVGSLAGFTAYVYLLQESTPARVATYAYVNPIVAVFLGWALGGEPVSSRMFLASAVIIGAVAIITTASTEPQRCEEQP
jgi:drug/metabolite transporter (DMT)-like permease